MTDNHQDHNVGQHQPWEEKLKQLLDSYRELSTQHDTKFMLSKQFVLSIPSPSDNYWRGVETGSNELLVEQPILVILDLNGTLLFRPNKSKSHLFHKRLQLDEFLEFVFERFHVMIWTTARPENAAKMRDGMLNGLQKRCLVDTWDRRSFNLSPAQYNNKITVYKQLEWVWSSAFIQQQHPGYYQGHRWDQSNTILLDDSTLKAKTQPHNHILVPEFLGNISNDYEQHGHVLQRVASYIQIASKQSNVSAYIKAHPFKVKGPGPFIPLGEFPHLRPWPSSQAPPRPRSRPPPRPPSSSSLPLPPPSDCPPPPPPSSSPPNHINGSTVPQNPGTKS